MWSHWRFRSLAGFRFSDVNSCGRDEDVIEARNSKSLSLPVIRLVRVAEPSLRICKSLSRIQSRISSPCWSWGWKESRIWKWPLRLLRMSEEGPGLTREGSNKLCWVKVLDRYTLQCLSQVDLVALRQMERISIPAFLRECSFSNIADIKNICFLLIQNLSRDKNTAIKFFP